MKQTTIYTAIIIMITATLIYSLPVHATTEYDEVKAMVQGQYQPYNERPSNYLTYIYKITAQSTPTSPFYIIIASPIEPTKLIYPNGAMHPSVPSGAISFRYHPVESVWGGTGTFGYLESYDASTWGIQQIVNTNPVYQIQEFNPSNMFTIQADGNRISIKNNTMEHTNYAQNNIKVTLQAHDNTGANLQSYAESTAMGYSLLKGKTIYIDNTESTSNVLVRILNSTGTVLLQSKYLSLLDLTNEQMMQASTINIKINPNIINRKDSNGMQDFFLDTEYTNSYTIEINGDAENMTADYTIYTLTNGKEYPHPLQGTTVSLIEEDTTNQYVKKGYMVEYLTPDNDLYYAIPITHDATIKTMSKISRIIATIRLNGVVVATKERSLLTGKEIGSTITDNTITETGSAIIQPTNSAITQFESEVNEKLSLDTESMTFDISQIPSKSLEVVSFFGSMFKLLFDTPFMAACGAVFVMFFGVKMFLILKP